ncbi:MAG: hypothetical protein FJY74_06105 [Candidatus Eisenbacteria bacterium]|nr:hypothetical protein [Candidatus Eisenbacteria bacterium]
MTNTAGDRKKLLIVAGLAAALIAVVVLRVLPGGAKPGSTASASPIPSILEPRPASELDADPKHLQAVAKVAKARAGEPYAGDDLRDPMVPLAGARTARSRDEERPPEPAPVTLPPMSLYGIVWDPVTPVALIDGDGVHVGDTVKGAKVVSIDRNRVVLSYRSRQFVLTVE